jgi:nucleotide-binding universal stress UspA family protein
MSRIDRVVAGVSGSPGNLPALRYAADLARACDAELLFVHAWVLSGPEFLAWQFPSDPLVAQWRDDAWQRLWHALDMAFGGLPADIPVEPLIRPGLPGPVLVSTACQDGATLVVGAGRRGVVGRLRHSQVGRYCFAHASCTVIAVPAPALDRATARAVRGWARRHDDPPPGPDGTTRAFRT